MTKRITDRKTLEAMFNDKISLPSEIYDLLHRYVALNASKQILPWTPDYVQNSEPESYEYALQTYPQKVNALLNDLHHEITSRNLSGEVAEGVGLILGENLLAAQQVMLFNAKFKRSDILN